MVYDLPEPVCPFAVMGEFTTLENHSEIIGLIN
jgi:hypothetical protein